MALYLIYLTYLIGQTTIILFQTDNLVSWAPSTGPVIGYELVQSFDGVSWVVIDADVPPDLNAQGDVELLVKSQDRDEFVVRVRAFGLLADGTRYFSEWSDVSDRVKIIVGAKLTIPGKPRF